MLTRPSGGVPRLARADELRHRQPDCAEEVQGGRGHGRLRTASSTRPARSARSIRSAPGRTCSSRGRSATSCAREEPDATGARRPNARPSIDLPARSPTTQRGCRRCRRGEIQGYDIVEPQDIAHDQERRAASRSSTGRRSTSATSGSTRRCTPFEQHRSCARPSPTASTGRLWSTRSTAGVAVVANQFLPPQRLRLRQTGVPSYPYDPAKAKALLQQAGLTLPVQVDFWYPTNVSRPYMPDPQRTSRRSGEPQQVRLQGRTAQRTVAPGLPRPTSRTARPASTCSAGPATTATRRTS